MTRRGSNALNIPIGLRIQCRIGAVAVPVLLAFSLATSTGALTPQDATAPPAPSLPDTFAGHETIDADTVRARLDALKALAEPDTTQRQTIGQLEQTLVLLREITDDDARVTEFEILDRGAADRLAQLRRDLDAAPVEPVLDAPPDARPEELTPMLEAARAQVTAAHQAQADTAADQTRRDDRRAQIPALMAAATTRLDTLDDTLAASPDPEQLADLEEARHWNRLAERQAIEALLMRMAAEIRSYDTRRELLQTRGQWAIRRTQDAQRLVEAWDSLIGERRQQVAEQTRREAHAARLAAANLHPVVRTIVEQNAALAEDLAALSLLNNETIARKAEVEAQLTRWTDRFADARQLVDDIGLTEAIGILLRTHRSQLPPPPQVRGRLLELEQEMKRVQLEFLSLTSERDAIEATDIDAMRLLEASDVKLDEGKDEVILAATIQALDRQRQLLADIIALDDIYFNDALDELYERQAALLRVSRKYRSFIDERVLWIQSTSRLELADLARSAKATRWLIAPTHWIEVGTALAGDIQAHPGPFPLGVILCLALIIMRGRLSRSLGDLGRPVTGTGAHGFGLTLGALALTIVVAAVWPLLLATVGWRLMRSPDSTVFSAAVAEAIWRLARVWFMLAFLRQLCRPDGLGVAHFRWREESCAIVRRHLVWFTPIAIPLVVIINTLEANADSFASLGRILGIIGIIAVTTFATRVLHPQHGVVRDLIARRRDGWLDRLKFLWFGGIFFFAIVLTIGSVMGYQYTANALTRQAMHSAALVVLTLVGYATLLRGVVVAQRRMVLRHEQERREADADTPAITMVVPARFELDVEALSGQTKQLLRSVVVMVLLVGLWGIWADVLPALGLLNEVELWTTLETLPAGAAAGAAVEVPVTLADALLAFVIFTAMIIVSRDIPGLLEIAILQRLPFTRSARYAITTIVRYILIVVGLVLTFSAIEIGWSKVQWLVAAMGFGVGLGLRDIVADFVSGLIILFERPVRVGDAVTVGETSGRVTRIRVRSTTIRTWDRKELIIPNRQVVTKEIMNWTLSDSTLRIKIPLGVAHGTEIDLVRKILLETTRNNDDILDEPAPRVVFVGISDSALDFELRVFANVSHLVQVKDDLYTRIDRAFRETGVRIAFQQRSVHIHATDDERTLIDLAAERPDGDAAS